MTVLCHSQGSASEIGSWTLLLCQHYEKGMNGEIGRWLSWESMNTALAQASGENVWLPQPREAPKSTQEHDHQGQPLERAQATVAVQCWAGPRLWNSSDGVSSRRLHDLQ